MHSKHKVQRLLMYNENREKQQVLLILIISRENKKNNPKVQTEQVKHSSIIILSIFQLNYSLNVCYQCVGIKYAIPIHKHLPIYLLILTSLIGRIIITPSSFILLCE
jgi:hypothetical protein